ncbi:MAG: YajQ family cyclic di-GMP-binding protein, partial [Dehalococcoidia bacterium]
GHENLDRPQAIERFPRGRGRIARPRASASPYHARNDAFQRGTLAASAPAFYAQIMAQEFSFDVVSDFDRQELVNAIDQAKREIGTRYDFRGITAEIELHDADVTLTAESDFKLTAMHEILVQRLVKRDLSPKILDAGAIQPAARGNVRQVFKLRRGIAEPLAKDLQKRIKSLNPKVQSRIQGDQLRVTSRDKDTLQAVIKELRGLDLETPLQFVNYR